MGCCESCGVNFATAKVTQSVTNPAAERMGIEEVAWVPQERSSFLESHRSSLTVSMLNESQKDLIDDDHAHEIEALVSELILRQDWKLHIDDVICQIKSLSGLTTNEGKLLSPTPIFSLTIDFGVDVDLNTVLTALYQPDVRMKWDKGIIAMEEAEVSNNVWLMYSVTKMPFPFKNRDFSERRVLHSAPEAINVIQYSLTPENGGLPPSNKFERAEELFSLARIEKLDGATRLLLISQCDLKLPVALSQITAQAAIQMKNWARSLKKEVLQLDNL